MPEIEKNYNKTIKDCNDILSRMIASKEWDNDEKLTDIYAIYRDAIYNQIYEILLPRKNYESEKQLREIIAKYVIGYRDSKTKILYHGVIRPIFSKIQQYSAKKNYNQEILARYLDLYDDFYAMAALRSFQHFCLYMEWDIPEKDRIWCYSTHIAKPLWYFMGKMALDGSIKKFFKQTPTGYFKTWSDSNFQAWLFGLDKDTDCIKVTGNPKMPKVCLNGVVTLMTKKRYAKIFPEYAKFNCDKDAMFEIRNMITGELKIKGSFKNVNLLCIAKETAIDGGRFKWRFYDDVTRAMDCDNIDAHDKDDDKYNDTWRKRRYTENEDFEIFSGTAYNIYDFLCRRRDENGFENATPLHQYKYTSISPNKNTVFLMIPKLDWDTDEITLPAKYSTESAREERNKNYEKFMAMEQQQPIPPEGLPFDYKRIKTYDNLPKKENEGGTRSNFCRASLDTARTGANNLALGIHSKTGNMDYLVDCFYKQCPLDFKMPDGRPALEHCCDLIIKHQVTELLCENNTVSNIKQQIDDILHKRGYYACTIYIKYSVSVKNDKIFNMQSTILEYICFPRRGLFAEGSMMGKYMKDIVTWSVKAKIDDSIDNEAMYSEQFWFKNTKQNTIEILNRRIM